MYGSASKAEFPVFFTQRVPDMTLSARLAATAIASLLLAGSAFAQSTAMPPAKTDAPVADKAAPAATDKKAHSAASLECSKEADDKGLKGKDRKKFRRACKKEKAGTETKTN
jgi:invasion protein IalB